MERPLRNYEGKQIIGIDLGTTNSGVSIWRDEMGRVEMLADADGKTLTPSMVGWTRTGDEFVVGRAAEALGNHHPERVAYSIKRYIGRWFKDPAVFYSYRDLVYTVESGGGLDQLRDVVVNFGADDQGRPMRLSAPEISARVLAKLRADAAAALGLPLDEVTYAVITVPAYFNVLQRRATILAGKLAGLDVVDILNEPTAAALAYRDVVLDVERERRILVYDLGGGTFDISLLEVSQDEGGYLFFTSVVDGDTRLGGDDIDNAVVRWLMAQIDARYGRKVRLEDLVTRERLRDAGEAAKIALSDVEETLIDLSRLDLGGGPAFDAQIPMTRADLNGCAADVIARTQAITRRAVEQIAGLGWDEIDQVLLVGGMTLMPAIQQSVEELTGRPPHVIARPQEAVALGAGEYGRILSRGTEKFNENSLINVIALPLGIHLPLEEQSFRPLVPANSQVPFTSAPYPVTTTENNQQQIDVEILQGRRPQTTKAEESVVLGTLSMEILPAPRGVPKFHVEFDVRSDGTLRVLVTDVRSNQPPRSMDIVETSVTIWRDQAQAPTEADQTDNG